MGAHHIDPSHCCKVKKKRTSTHDTGIQEILKRAHFDQVSQILTLYTLTYVCILSQDTCLY